MRDSGEPFGRRILVLIPHPDDEVVGCAVAIRRATAAGARVFAIYLTTGLPPTETAWPWRRAEQQARLARRRAEALMVATRLQLDPVAFMDWPSRDLKNHLGEARDLVAGQAAVLSIDQLWVPAYEGAHQDHDVANFLGAQLRRRTEVLEFPEYNCARGVRTNEFPFATGHETVLSLSPDEVSWKRGLVARYRSERANLAHVGYAREVLRPLALYDYASPPHAGLLFYERFDWVPFRHPRLDFTSPADVCRALTGPRS
ncbi:MAG TPA: PIG-L family deacetylase [Polyangia bacterium]|nr:PIG-L family deacetylase [Polyangia bacterium]